MGPVKLRREGDNFVWMWEQENIVLRLSRLREEEGDVVAELLVQTARPVEGNRPGHYFLGRLNLLAPRSRQEVVRMLATRTDKIPWRDMLEYAIVETVGLWREGEPVIDLASLPEPAAAPALVEPLLAEKQPTVIYAQGGSGKSFLALAIGLAVQTGQALPPPLRVRRRTAVLYLNWEDDAEDQRVRLGYLARGWGLEALPSYLHRRMHRPLADDLDAVRRWVSERAIGLLIIDSIAMAAGGELKETEPVIRFFQALRELRAASLIISHISKEGMMLRQATPYGNVFVINSARSVWELRRDLESREEVVMALYHRKVNHGPLWPTPIGLRLRFDEGRRLVTLSAADVAEHETLAESAHLGWRILAILRQAREPLTAQDLAERLEIGENSVRAMLSRLRGQGHVVALEDSRGGRGRPTRWALAASAEDAPF